MKAKDTFLLNKTTQNPILGRRAWFWHVASHIVLNNCLRSLADLTLVKTCKEMCQEIKSLPVY